MIPPVAVHCGFGLLLTAASLPLALRLVPRNRLYGIRVAKAFESDENWYAINAYGGWWLLGYGVSVIAFGVFARHLAPARTSPWMAPFTVGPMLPTFPILMIVSRYAKRFPSRRA